MITGSKPQNVEELQAMVQERLEQRQTERRREERSLPSAPLLWMTLVSDWTEPLLTFVADHLLGSEWNARRIGEVIEQLTDRGWLQRTAPPTLRHRSIPTVIRLAPQVAERQLERQLAQAREPLDFWANLAALAMAIEEAQEELDPQLVPTSTRRWAHLAAASVEEDHSVLKSLTNRLRLRSWQPTAEFLEQRVDDAVSAANPAQAQRWLEAAQPMAAVLSRTLDTTLDIALRRCALRLELYHRRRHDLKHLEHFLERDDQMHALEGILRGDTKDPKAPWALHLLGGGGVGKTMLVRHLTARLADREHWGLSIARVDFDFLNPDYPRRSPGLLLWAFAQELRVFDSSGKVGQVFDDGDRVLRQLHDQLHAGEGSGELLDHPLLLEGLDIYGQALELLPQPVVFVIDTCEELTKPRAGADGHFNVEATFHILERLHNDVPTLRVLFAGRRPLAATGDGWSCPSCPLPPRPFLRLFEMRGFSSAEATTYLEHRDVPSHLVEAVVLRSSPDSGGVAEIQWSRGQGPEDITRCNPYELHFYAEWALDDPPPSPEDIERAGGNRYVELRILRRLGHGPLESLLPLLGLARHADEALLQAVSGLEGEAFENLLRELESQEWVELRSTSSADAPRRIFSVEEGLRLRLLSYFRDQSGRLETQRQLAANALRQRILEGDPAELDGSDVDAALRVMEPEPDADLWWRDVEARLFSQRDAEWVAQQASILVGPEGAAALPDDASWPELRTVHPLRPAVLATLALAESQTPGGGLTPWMETVETAEGLPHIGADLALRARAMVLTAQHVNGFDLVPGDAWDLWLAVDELPGIPTPETVAALVAAAEAIVEHYEEHRRTPGSEQLLRLDVDAEPGRWATTELHRHIARWASEATPGWKDAPWTRQLEAMLLALDGRVVARLGDRPEEATERFHKARALAAGLNKAPHLQAWSPPDDFFTRIKLEAMRALYPSVLSAAECLDEFGPRAPARGVEWDRSLSQVAELALALGPKAEVFGELLAEKADDPVHEMHCRAHFETPPFPIRRAQLLAASGKVEQGRQALQDIIRRAATLDSTVVQHAARAQLDLGIRLRLFDDAPGYSLADSPEPDDHDVLSLADNLGHPPMKRQPFSAQDTRRAMHGRWRTLTRPTAEDCLEAVGAAQQRWRQIEVSGGTYDEIDAHLVLDGWEASLLAEKAPESAKSSAPLTRRKVMQVVDDAIATVRRPEGRWRLYLRQQALSRRQASQAEQLQLLHFVELGISLPVHLGLHRAARIAWREADLLALRLPAAAAPLFGFARELFKQVDDTLSEAICLTAHCHCRMSTPRSSQQPPPDLDNLEALWHRLGAGLDADSAKLEPHLRPWWARAQLLVLRLGATYKEPPAPWMLKGVDEPMLAWFYGQETVPEKTDTPLSKSVEPSWEEHTGVFDLGTGAPGGFSVAGGGKTAPKDPDPNASSGSLPPPSPPEPVSKGASPSPSPSPSPAPITPNANQKPGRLARRGWVSSLLESAVMLAGAGLLLAVYLLVLAGFIWFAAVLWKDVPSLVLICVVIVGIGLFTCGRSALRWNATLRSWLGRKHIVHIQISDLPDPLSPYAEDALILESSVTKGWMGKTRKTTVLPTLNLSHDVLSEHKKLYEDRLGPPITSEFYRSIPWNRGQVMTLKPEVAEELPWEGMLASLSPKGFPRFRRGRPSVDWPSPDPSPYQNWRAVYLAGPSLPTLNQAHQSLQRLEDAKIRIRAWEFSGQMAKLLENPRSEPVAHLLGVPIETSAGYRWRLQARRDRADLDIQADDLPRAFPGLQLLLLQETPVSEMHPRSTADRRQANYLRAFAAEAQRVGVPAVLTIPHMRPETASRCIQEVAKLLVPYAIPMPSRLVASDPSLLDTVDAIRRHIRRDDAMDDEAAWDVVLYSPPGWRNPFQ